MGHRLMEHHAEANDGLEERRCREAIGSSNE